MEPNRIEKCNIKVNFNVYNITNAINEKLKTL